MSLPSLSVRRPIGTVMLYLGVILLGWISLSNLSVNLLPDLSYPKITVMTEYTGASPEEMELAVTSPLESALASVPGIKRTLSSSRDGVSLITLEFHWGTDMDFALLHVKEKTEETRRNLPETSGAPVIMEWDPSAAPILTTVVSSSDPKRNRMVLKELCELVIKPRLEQLEGISMVEVRGGDDLEVSVEVDPVKAQALGIELSDVATAIEQNNTFLGSGRIMKDKLLYNLRIESELVDPAQINQVVVASTPGRKVLLSDIGRAFYKTKERQGDIRYQGVPSLSLLVFRESGGNTVSATLGLERTLSELEQEFAPLEFHIIHKEASLIVSSIRSLVSSLVIGGFLAFLVLLLFLQNLKDPLLGALSILISIISTFTLMYLLSVNLNIMSLGGLVLGVGMFVDNAIIVIESLHRHRLATDPRAGIVAGATEVSAAITASTLTTISIFLPVIYLYGVTGKLFKDQALTVSFSLLSSLLVAITLLPALSALGQGPRTLSLLLETGTPGRALWRRGLRGVNRVVLFPLHVVGLALEYLRRGILLVVKGLFGGLAFLLQPLAQRVYHLFNRTYSGFDDRYHRFLDTLLDHKGRAALLGFLVIFLIALAYLPLKTELLPAPESARFEIRVATQPVYGFQETDLLATQLETWLGTLPKVRHVYTESGAVSAVAQQEDEVSVNTVHLVVLTETVADRDRLMPLVRERLKREGHAAFSVYREKNTLSQYLSLEGNSLQLRVYYRDLEEGRQAAELIFGALKPLSIAELKTSSVPGKPSLAIRFNQDLLDRLHLNRESIAQRILQAVRGQKAGDLRLTQRAYDILVRVPTEGIMDLEKVLDLPVPAGAQKQSTVFMRDLITVAPVPSIKEINREAQERYFQISGDVPARDLEPTIRRCEGILAGLNLPSGVRTAFTGQQEERNRAFKSLFQAVILAILLVYMIMAAQFENLLQPLIIMITVPMGLLGAFSFLLLSGGSLNIISGIGLLVMVGIGVNDAIVKIEYANQLRREGSTLREAIMQASRVRLRPILMTSFTTIMGLIPMALSRQTGSELQRPLAFVVIGGLLCTTFLTLIFIPVLYEWMEGLGERLRRRNEG